MESQDRVVRAMTEEGTFRVVAVRTTETARAVVEAQGVSGHDARRLAELVTLAVLYRETMAPNLRVQVLLRGAGTSGTMTADSHPDGWARGLVRGEGPIDLAGDGALLSLQRPLRNGELHVGTVAIPEDGTLASAAMAYFAQSEQTTTMVALGSVVTDDDGARVVTAGGFLVQVLAEARDVEGPLALLTVRLEEFVDLRDRLLATDASPDALVDEVLYGFDVARLAESKVVAGCDCSESRFVSALLQLDAPSFASLLEGDEPIESTCEFCKRLHRVSPAHLRTLRPGGA